MNKFFIFVVIFFYSAIIGAQTTVEGYVFETNNRGYLYNVKLQLTDKDGKQIATEFTNNDGYFKFNNISNPSVFNLEVNKDFFVTKKIEVNTEKSENSKLFLKIDLDRKPGYSFEANVIEKKTSLDIPGVSIMDAKIEIYNNTTEKQVLTIEKSDSPHFNYFLEEGNHYTIMIRKEGYFVKRIEAFVNVKGCILCMEGVNTINNGLSDNLTQGHKKGVIQASIELAPLRLNETMKIENIYYDYNQFFIRKEAGKELDKIVTLLKNNPGIQVELGSHTDSRGNDEYNLELSENRAKAAVEYIIKNGIDKNRILSKGYGETKLTNRCKDGVVCSEAEHQNNRRTELKILGIKKDPNDEKTLEEIIRYENIDKKLAEIENQKTIEVVEGQDIKEAISNAETIAKQKKLAKEQLSTEFHNDNEFYTSWDYSHFAKADVFEFTNTKLDGTSTLSSVTIYELPSNFTGYLIECFITNDKINSGNNIFSRFDNVVVSKRVDKKYHYYIGNFKKKENAENFNRLVVSPMYPNSRVVNFKNGNPIK